MAEIPLAPLERIIKKAGAERVSEDAKEKLREVLEAKAIEIAKEANKYALHAKRKTIKKQDITLANKQ
jgi:histone H3/H4